MNYLRPGIQTIFAEAGDAACYAFDLVDVAGEYLGQMMDACTSLMVGIDSGCIYYNFDDSNDDNNFYVQNPARFLFMLTGVSWSVEKKDAPYDPIAGDFIIQRWERVKTGAVIAHFNRPNFDSLKDSLTVKTGKIVSYRVCRPMA